eukprot:CAMPEP_0170591636 /NCGR_PEP_ID=MMETSP0224-20130122/12506_1 /TAXON_ID=285029 /ORGANISM="Togula jolla, Strain CCCM 725" /LENGTH=112 /DNA_ID=CAMNT_0010915507 /DNA_START=64 /DNA_END=398 /DNA_ORIENTATION=+
MTLLLSSVMAMLALSLAMPMPLETGLAADDLLLLQMSAAAARNDPSVKQLEWMKVPNDRPDGGVNDCLDVPFGGVPVGEMYSYPSPDDTRFNSSGTSRCYRAYVPPSEKPGP